MIIKAEDIQKQMSPMCPGCEYFTWDVVTIGKDDIDHDGIQYVQIGCKNEEMCMYMQSRFIKNVQDLYTKI